VQECKWGNEAARTKTSAFYCSPAKLALALDNYINIIDRQIKADTVRLPEERTRGTWIEVLLMVGLQETFPCKGK